MTMTVGARSLDNEERSNFRGLHVPVVPVRGCVDDREGGHGGRLSDRPA